MIRYKIVSYCQCVCRGHAWTVAPYIVSYDAAVKLGESWARFAPNDIIMLVEMEGVYDIHKEWAEAKAQGKSLATDDTVSKVWTEAAKTARR